MSRSLEGRQWTEGCDWQQEGVEHTAGLALFQREIFSGDPFLYNAVSSMSEFQSAVVAELGSTAAAVDT